MKRKKTKERRKEEREEGKKKPMSTFSNRKGCPVQGDGFHFTHISQSARELLVALAVAQGRTAPPLKFLGARNRHNPCQKVGVEEPFFPKADIPAWFCDGARPTRTPERTTGVTVHPPASPSAPFTRAQLCLSSSVLSCSSWKGFWKTVQPPG